MTHIPQDIINKLRLLVGINTNTVKALFAQYGIKQLRKDKDGFTENLIALLLNKALPTNMKGMDFRGLFEVKQITTRQINSGALRVKGDTPIANLEEGEFFASNVWDKTRKILCVLTLDDIIVDIRLFNGEKYKETMKKDWDLIQEGLRTKTEMFSLKEKWNNQIQMKKNGCILLSDSLTEGVDNGIVDQELYCSELFEENLAMREQEFKRETKTILDKVTSLLDGHNVSIADLVKLRELLDSKLEEAVGFKDVQDTLTF